MKGRSVVGVLVGGVVDIVATNAFAIPVALYVMIHYSLAGPDAGQTMARLITSDPSLVATLMVLGGLASVLGGFTAAWIAGRSQLIVGALSAYLCTALGIFGLLHDTSGTPLVQHVGTMLISPALGLLGGYLRALQTRRVARA